MIKKKKIKNQIGLAVDIVLFPLIFYCYPSVLAQFGLISENSDLFFWSLVAGGIVSIVILFLINLKRKEYLEIFNKFILSMKILGILVMGNDLINRFF